MLEWLVQGSPLQKALLFMFGILAFCSILFIISTVLIRMHYIRINRKEKEVTERFDELFFAYLEAPENNNIINRIASIEKSDEFLKHLLHYMQILKGRDHDLIQKLIVDIGFPGMLLKILREEGRWRRAYAAYALGVIKYRPATTSLLLAYNDEFYLVQYYAIQGIIRIQDRLHIKNAIKKLFTIPHLSSYQLMECLSELNQSSLSECVQLINETPDLSDEQLKLLVDLFFYKKYSGASSKILHILTYARDRELKLSCIRALGLLNYTPALPVLREQLGVSDWIVRSQAIRALGRIGDIGALPDFLEAMKVRNFWVSYNAALTLFDLGEVGINYLKKIRDDIHHPGQDVAKQILFEKKVYVGVPA